MSEQLFVGDIVYSVHKDDGDSKKIFAVYFFKIGHLTNKRATLHPIDVLTDRKDLLVPNLDKFRKQGYTNANLKPSHTNYDGSLDAFVYDNRSSLELDNWWYGSDPVYLWDGKPLSLTELKLKNYLR